MSNEPSIATLPEQIAALPAAERSRVETLFAVTRSAGSLVLPPEMTGWITQTFGSVAAVQTQTVIKTLNRWTLEGALFNSLRAHRPMTTVPASLNLEAGGAEPFEQPLTATPADTFGRITGTHSITASNVAKYDGLHAVIIFTTHNPLALTAAEVADGFATAQAWLAAAHTAHPAAVYPFIMWNCLPRSGASQVHAHMQATLGEGSAYAHVEAWRRAAESYRAQQGQDYFAALHAAHVALGLGGTWGGVRWLAHLTPVKEKETILLAPTLGPDLIAALNRVLGCFRDNLGVRAFNVAIYQPPLAPVAERWTDFPVVVRLVDRGDPASATSDFGAMELFAQPVVAFDPWRLAERLVVSG